MFSLRASPGAKITRDKPCSIPQSGEYRFRRNARQRELRLNRLPAGSAVH
jgi:hypothetical protein